MDVTIDRGDPDTFLDVDQSSPTKIDLKISKAPPPAPIKPTRPSFGSSRPLPPRALFRSDIENVEETFKHFANPKKLKEPVEDDDTDDEESGDDEISGDHAMDTGGAGDDYSVDEPVDEDENTLKPAEGFDSLDAEKASLLFKLARSKRAGMPSSRSFSMHDDIREMRAEMARITHEIDLDASLKFQRKMLMMFVSTSEFMNKKYDPFQIQLDGWGENVHDSINDYDKVFERLHEKYKSKISMAPEIELLTMVGGSALMFHLTKTMFQRSLPGLSANPELMTGMLSAMSKAANAAPTANAAPQDTSTDLRREIKGPQFDMSGLGGLGGLGGMFNPPAFPQSTTHPATAPPAPKKTVNFNTNTKKRPEPSETSDDDSRMSDVPSDDLSSIPDDLTSIGGDDILVPAGGRGRGGRGGRGGGRGRGSKIQKTIITL
jgi:hypothetical protein